MMITRKTRALSILAVVALIASMLASFALPAMAADAADVAALRAMYADVLANASDPNGTLKAALDALDADANAATNYDAHKAALAAAAAGAGVSSQRPRYAFKEAYRAAGYAANVFAISAPEDWLAMVEESKIVGTTKGETFEGYTFHVTNNVDFKDVAMEPLNYSTGASDDKVDDAVPDYSTPFMGTIEGHGYGFENINVVVNKSANKAVGLIGKLGAKAVINHFGVNSGKITSKGGNYDTACTFGEPLGAAKLTKVWSGAEISATGLHAYAYGLIGSNQWSNSVLNGGYFYGVLKPGTCSDHAGYNAEAIQGENDRGTYVYNAISDAATADVMLKHNCSDAVRASVNVFGVNMETLIYGHNECTYNCDTGKNSASVSTIEEAAWRVNDAQPAAKDVDPIYFTKKDGKITFGDAIDRIYRVKVVSEVAEATIYTVAGDVIDLKAMGLYSGEGSSFVANDGAVEVKDFKITVPTSDVVVNVTYNEQAQLVIYSEQLREILAKYENIDSYLVEDPEAMDAFKADSEAALQNQDLEAILLMISLEPELDLDMVRYPNYRDYEKYKDVNAGNNWAISSKEDWLAMVDASYAKPSVTFAGMNFHLMSDIDFGDVAMKPLCYGGEFKGNIYGHGYGFDNVLIDSTTIETQYNAVGLIYTMSEGELNNFGINSGAIDGSGVAYEGSIPVGGLVGRADKSTNTNKLYIYKCWNGADIDGITTSKQCSAAALFGTGSNTTDNNRYVVINGFLNTGDVTSHSTFTGELYPSIIIGATCYHYIGGIFNVVNTGTITGPAYDANALPNPGKGACFIRLNAGVSPKFENNASMGDLPMFYYSPTDPGKYPKYYNGFTDVYALAYKMNQGNSGLQDSSSNAITPVYYTVKNGEIAFGADDGSDQVRKITFVNSGADVGFMYAAAGSTVTLNCPGATGYSKLLTYGGSVLNGDQLTLANEDAIVEIEVDNAESIRVKTEVLQGILDKYAGIKPEELANGEAFTAWKTAAEKAIADGDLAGLNQGIDGEVVPALKEGFYPPYSKYDSYKSYNTANAWGIATPQDWLAMVADSAAATPKTFKGYTFHVLNDIDFTGITDMPALNHVAGVGQVDVNADIAAFMGAIEGHGFAFKNVDVLVTDTTHTSGGLIGRMGAGASINDFGVESGTIEVSGGSYDQVATFGEAVGAVSITKVWSGVTLVSNKGANCGSHGILAHSQRTALVLNGAYFYGTLITKGTLNTRALAIAGDNTRGISIYNGLGAPIVSESITDSKAYACFKFTSTTETYYANIYGVGIPANHADIGAANPAGQVASALEGAWKINNAQPAADGVAPIYFTLNKNNEIRPNGTADNQIRKVTVMNGGTVAKTVYAIPGTKITLDVAGATGYELPAGAKSSISGSELTLGNEDAVVTAVSCKHTNATYTPIAGTKTHTIHCNDCGQDTVGDCVVESWTAVGGANHTGTCKDCGGVQTGDCVGKFVANAEDCTKDGHYEYDCCDRADVADPGSGSESHTFGNNWTTTDAPEGKEVNKCANCLAKEIRTIGKVEAAAQSAVNAGSSVKVDVTIPVALTEGTLTMNAAEGLEITDVSGNGIAWTSGSTATINAPIAAGAVVTVTLKADSYKMVADGALEVRITNAKNGTETVTDAMASAVVAFESIIGDADGDTKITLFDPLTVLEYAVDSNVSINLANAEADRKAGVTVADAIEIVRIWLRTPDA